MCSMHDKPEHSAQAGQNLRCSHTLFFPYEEALMTPIIIGKRECRYISLLVEEHGNQDYSQRCPLYHILGYPKPSEEDSLTRF